MLLYHEQKQYFNEQKGMIVTDQVKVTLVRWISKRIPGDGDFVLRKQVLVDGKVEVSGRKAFDPIKHDKPEMLRMAIALFDELLEGHPNKGLLE